MPVSTPAVSGRRQDHSVQVGSGGGQIRTQANCERGARKGPDAHRWGRRGLLQLQGQPVRNAAAYGYSRYGYGDRTSIVEKVVVENYIPSFENHTNFERLVLGCTEADLLIKHLMSTKEKDKDGKLLTRSTIFTFISFSLIAKIQ